jgi:5-methylcytosine-specific restriction endonuclease McrA
MKHTPIEESINQRFGRLILLTITGKDKHGNKTCLCQCDCGGTKIASINKLRAGEVRSCGCMRRENAIKQIPSASNANSKLNEVRHPRIVTAFVHYRKGYADGDLLFEDFMRLSQLPCYYCGAVLCNTANVYKTRKSKSRYTTERIEAGYFTYNGLDRIDSKLPHNLNNVVPCCIHCNKAKLDRTQKEFLDWIAAVYKLHHVDAE